MDASKIETFVGGKWDDEIVPQLVEYIRIPNKSPMFDADWVKNGYMEDAVKLMEAWAGAQPIPGMTLEVVRLEGRTPLIFIDIPASGRSEEHTSELQSLMRIPYAVFCLKKKKQKQTRRKNHKKITHTHQ